MADLTETIEAAAQTPASASSPDGSSATARPLAELIAADEHLTKKQASQTGKSALGMLRNIQVTSPGATGT